ncbi:hypothetical protein D1B17_06965 [Companilactobacillus zhachilii]|uniref:Uncharacterized protein n=1 Tax=Companilactobacillus zhachilii TaxID=2304606 RepID=A0A386PV95_9LACO|nr:hypothetical protein [Companilactobacillus zhachilii]AYE38390.1 hypothetical protein D1B17_06965 [Companilactobacillus zhachilii]
MTKFNKSDWTLKISLESADVYQSNDDSHLYARVDKLNDPVISKIDDNSNIESLIKEINPDDFAGSYYPLANKISVELSDNRLK